MKNPLAQIFVDFGLVGAASRTQTMNETGDIEMKEGIPKNSLQDKAPYLKRKLEYGFISVYVELPSNVTSVRAIFADKYAPRGFGDFPNLSTLKCRWSYNTAMRAVQIQGYGQQRVSEAVQLFQARIKDLINSNETLNDASSSIESMTRFRM